MPSESATVVNAIELPGSEFVFGSSPGMREVRKTIECACQDSLPVFIEGESGTGKEVIGRFLHGQSCRRDGPFLKFNSAAILTNLVQEELFGSVRSAGQDLRLRRRGAIALASGGTLFIDEVGDLDVATRQKLALMLDSGYYRNMDGAEDLAVSARLICATSRSLGIEAERSAGSPEFPGGIAHHRIRLLPLRERKQDIPLLCEYLLARFARDFARPVPRLSPYVLNAFQQWKWPGNIRELENWIARIVIFGSEEAIDLEFNRQLLAWQETLPRKHRTPRVVLSRTRHLRRHS